MGLSSFRSIKVQLYQILYFAVIGDCSLEYFSKQVVYAGWLGMFPFIRTLTARSAGWTAKPRQSEQLSDETDVTQ